MNPLVQDRFNTILQRLSTIGIPTVRIGFDTLIRYVSRGNGAGFIQPDYKELYPTTPVVLTTNSVFDHYNLIIRVPGGGNHYDYWFQCLSDSPDQPLQLRGIVLSHIGTQDMITSMSELKDDPRTFYDSNRVMAFKLKLSCEPWLDDVVGHPMARLALNALIGEIRATLEEAPKENLYTPGVLPNVIYATSYEIRSDVSIGDNPLQIQQYIGFINACAGPHGFGYISSYSQYAGDIVRTGLLVDCISEKLGPSKHKRIVVLNTQDHRFLELMDSHHSVFDLWNKMGQYSWLVQLT